MSSSLVPDKRDVVLTLLAADRAEKLAKKTKSELREQLFHIATLEREREVLPRRTTKIPVGFLNSIGMQENHFIASRWPGWRKVESRKVDDEGNESRDGTWIEYLLEKDPVFLPWNTEVEDDGITVVAGRAVQQKAPEIDQRTLQKDMPDIFDAIMKPHVVYEVDVDKLEALLASRPDLLPKLELHFSYPEPIVKLASIKEKVDEDG